MLDVGGGKVVLATNNGDSPRIVVVVRRSGTGMECHIRYIGGRFRRRQHNLMTLSMIGYFWSHTQGHHRVQVPLLDLDVVLSYNLLV